LHNDSGPDQSHIGHDVWFSLRYFHAPDGHRHVSARPLTETPGASADNNSALITGLVDRP
jgi:hypothetical protein